MHLDRERRIRARRVVGLVPNKHVFFGHLLAFFEVQGRTTTRILPSLPDLLEELHCEVRAKPAVLTVDHPKDVSLSQKDSETSCFIIFRFETDATNAALARASRRHIPD